MDMGLAGHVYPDRSQKTMGDKLYFLSSSACDEAQKYIWNFFLRQGLCVYQQLCFVDGAKHEMECLEN